MYIRVPIDPTLGEATDGYELLSDDRLGSIAAAPALQSMTGRLLCASNLTYTTPSTALADAFYEKKAGFAERPTVITGTNPVDSCLIGNVQPSSLGPAETTVILAFRGTASANDWQNNAEFLQVPFAGNPTMLVHKGFNDSVISLFNSELVTKLRAKLGNPAAKLFITGHSKGGALAYMAAVLLNSKHGIKADGVVTFEAARPGHPNFAAAFKATGIPSLRYEYRDDLVPHMPPSGPVTAGLKLLMTKSPVLADVLSRWIPEGASLNYEPAGTLRFIDWQDNEVGDSTTLYIQRLARLWPRLASMASIAAPPGTPALAARATTAALAARYLHSMHSISCGPSAAETSGLWRAVWKTQACT